jgi:CubicO group peptidase (beta-lactamase class C family)
MWKRILTIITTGLLLSSATIAQSADNEQLLADLQREILAAQELWEIPGLAVGILRDGEILLAEGYGHRDLAGRDAVDTSTLFKIGSCSKAFTAFSLGFADEQELLSLSAPVRDVLPDFEMPDEWVTQKITLVDLLTHQSGFGRYDFLSHAKVSRAELAARVRGLPTRAEFRGKFTYSNQNYVLAAHVLEVATGESWEDYMAREVLSPLGMDHTFFTREKMVASANYALPYQKPLRDLKAPAYVLEIENGGVSNPAGGVISNLDDLLKWLRLCLDGGAPILSTDAWETQIQTHVGLGYSATDNFRSSGYGLGWFTKNYRGHHLVSHSGIISGYCASVSFMPHEELGIVVLTNMKHHSLHDALPLVIYDRLLDLEPYDHNGQYVQTWQGLENYIRERDEGLLAGRIQGTTPSLEPVDYHGRYENPVYGVAEVGGSEMDLDVTINDQLILPLEHFHHDVWFSRDVVNFEFDMLGFQFRKGPSGRVDEMLVREELTGEPILFTKIH